jgi:predicted Zn-dependent protease
MPNYLNQLGDMFRWENFPVRVSIDRASMPMAGDRILTYEQAIRDGVIVWALATQSIVGTTILDFDLANPNIVARLEEPDEDERVLQNEGTFTWLLLDARRLRRGTIRILPEIIREVTQNQRLEESSDYIANIVGHEMGHALGVQKHSDDHTDLMHSFRNHGRIPYPWVTQRDRNTMQEAYCR